LGNALVVTILIAPAILQPSRPNSVDALTIQPLDRHVIRSADGTRDWGVSSQGVHVNVAGYV